MLTVDQAAAYRGDVDNVRLLIEHGAMLNTPAIGLYGNELQGKYSIPKSLSRGY